MNCFSLSLNDQDTLMDQCSQYITSTPLQGKPPLLAKPLSSSLWPPLKSARYCKKQMNRNLKGRGAITPSIMLMHEASINHHRVTSALNELSTTASNSANIFDLSTQNISKPFWSKRSCQEFWNEYLECDSTLIHDLSLLTIKSKGGNLEDCPHACYAKITKSIRKLLKRTFTGAPTFSELENLVKSFNQGTTVENLNFDLSCGQVLNSSNSGATIKLDTPFHRVWLHAICQYHGLSSQSKTVNDQRLVHIKKMVAKNVVSPRINLYNFLLDFV